MTYEKNKNLFVRVLCLAAFIFLFCSALTAPDECADVLKKTVSGFYLNVLPVLFPFMTASKFLTGSGVGSILEKTVGKVFSKSTGLPELSVTPFLLGCLCSYPIGASAAADLYKNGRIGKDDAEKTAAASNNTGPSFPVAVIGVSLFGSQTLGWLIYFSEIVSALTVACILFRRKTISERIVYKESNNTRGFGEIIADSVSSSSLNCITLSGTVAFFSLLCSRICTIFSIRDPMIKALLYSVFEFSEGCRLSAALNGKTGAVISTFAISFGGLSVLAQSASLFRGTGVRIGKIAIFKIVQAAISSISVYTVLSFFPRLAYFTAAEYVIKIETHVSVLKIAVISFALISALYRIIHLIYKRR